MMKKRDKHLDPRARLKKLEQALSETRIESLREKIIEEMREVKAKIR